MNKMLMNMDKWDGWRWENKRRNIPGFWYHGSKVSMPRLEAPLAGPRVLLSDAITEGTRRMSKSLTDLIGTRDQRKERKRSKSQTRHISEATTLQSTPRDLLLWAETRYKSDAGRRVVNLLMLHAWRRRREDIESARTTIVTLNNQVANLNLQVYALRQILENEKYRVAVTTREMHKKVTEIAKYEEEKKIILKENDKLECEKKYLNGLISQLKNESNNHYNDLQTALSEVKHWENILKSERKQLKVLMEQKKELQDEIICMETLRETQSVQLEQLNQTNEDLNEKLDEQFHLLNKAFAQIHSLEEQRKLSEESEIKQLQILSEKDEQIKMLQFEIANMEVKLQKQDERNGEMGKLINERTKELMLMNDKLRELTQSQKFWGNRVIKMASLCTRIPIACFYTVATLLLPQPSYRSF